MEGFEFMANTDERIHPAFNWMNRCNDSPFGFDLWEAVIS